MALRHKIIQDIYEAPVKFASKVNIRQYMTNKREPAIDSMHGNLGKLSKQSDVIQDAYPRKQLFRKIAFKIRLGKQK
jgi:hypothetical protein